MTKQFDTLPTGLPDFNGAPIDDFDLPDYMFSDPIHYSKEWFDFIENSVSDDSIAQEYKQLITNIMQKQHGGDVRLSLAIFVYIIAHGFTVTLAEFDKISKEIRSRVENLEGKYKDLVEEWKNTLNGVTVDSELINARIDLHGIVYKTLKERLDDMQSKLEDLNATEAVFTLTHNQNGYPAVRAMYHENGLGVKPLGDAPLGGTNVKTIAYEAEYLDKNSVTVKVPLRYKLTNCTVNRIASNQYLLADGVKALTIEIGNENKSNVETTMEVTATEDFRNKISGSVKENPHIVKLATSSKTLNPSDSLWQETTYTVYRQIESTGDNKIATATTTEQGNSRNFLAVFDMVQALNRRFPTISCNADQAKQYISSITTTVHAKGSTAIGNYCQLNSFGWNAWQGGENTSNKTNEIKKMEATVTKIPSYLQADGSLNVLISNKPSDGKTPCSIMVDSIMITYSAQIPFAPIK